MNGEFEIWILCSQATEDTMPKRVTGLDQTVSAAFLAAVIALSINCPALAGPECIEQPTREPAEGSHWYYYSDSVKNRKCWYLGVVGAKAREPGGPPAQSNVVPTQTLSSQLSSAFGKSTAATPTVAPQDSAAREPRIIQGNSTNILKIQDTAPKEKGDIPEVRADPRKQSRINQAEREALFEDFLRWYEDPRNIMGFSSQTRSR
jgi:hypothetical protein